MPPTTDDSAQRILDRLKRQGEASVPELARAFDLSVETVRSQVNALRARGLVRRAGSRRSGPGRPEQVFCLTERAQAHFPNREAEVLRGLAAFLRDEGQNALLARYMERSAKERRRAALARLDGLEGAERLAEAARILTEDGYMAEVVEGEEDARPRIRLCHCPLRQLVEVTSAPCRAEIGFVRALVGDKLARVEYLPEGGSACTYAVGTAGGGDAA
jgi:predicted ArsR family transcriptional regulator